MSEVYEPGSHIAVDECMVGFTGKSALKTHIPNKPTPDGIKVWVLAEGGIFLRWLWHVPNKGPIGIPKTRSIGDHDYRLTPTQHVVISLLKQLLITRYYIYLDNLFSSLDLFKCLYDIDIGALGTARINYGINVEIAWRDNEIVLFLSSVYSAEETVTVMRRRPRNANSSHKRVARALFGDAYEKELPVPVAIDDYNHYMGAVDIGDQLRASYVWGHRWRRGPSKPLSWGFLLGTVIVNCYLLASKSGSFPKTNNGHLAWRNALVQQLFSRYSPDMQARHRARPGMFLDRRNRHVAAENHVKGKRAVRAACKVCSALRHAAKKRAAKKPSNDAVASAMPTSTGLPRTEWGCITCNVAICNRALCWDMFHHSNVGVW
jgi:hypothetical protein